MALTSNGRLLILHQPTSRILESVGAALVGPLQLTEYVVEPLFPATTMPMTEDVAGQIWSLAKPTANVQQNPWDVAHHAASQVGYEAYIEPDILHAAAPVPTDALEAVAGDELNTNYPPNDAVSPGWHLEPGFTGFATIRGRADGRGIRIAHLDTGYTPGHVSTPRHMHPELGWNFWDNNDDVVDPGTQVLGLLQPGHGTATLALLAGNRVDLTFRGLRYEGDFGGAPEADIVPVRIGASVVHVYSSTMARGLNYALAPRDSTAARCQVISLSHGGLPSASWATAVNALYEAGVTIVAASGDSFYEGLIDVATRFTVYPSAFNRVITAVGATYDRQPYKTTHLNVMQGCWGPDAIMRKASAAFTPNVAWMDREKLPDGFDMTGGGTSASTPQIAAACALWLQLYGSRFPADWRVVEACRLALFRSSDATQAGMSYCGWGTLNVPQMLEPGLADAIETEYRTGNLQKSAPDEVTFPFWRLLVGEPPPGSSQEAMYETEVAQIVLSSRNAKLGAAAQRVGNGGALDPAERDQLKAALLAEPISAALGDKIRVS